MKFKSYGLFLLVLYFLQTRRPAVLPTVEYMMDKTEFQDNLGNWSYDICKYMHRIEKSENVQSLEELLREFFFFYAYFDFSYVICTRSGNLVKNSDFAALENTDFELNSISIQDPLNLSWNVTSGLFWKYCKYFTTRLLYACEAYQDKSRWYPSQTDHWGILSFFDSQPSSIQKKRVAVQIPLPTEGQEVKFKENVISIFRHGLDFQCRSVGENELLVLKPNTGATAGDHEHSEESGSTLLCRFECTTSDTWFGRSNYESQVGTMNFGSQITTTSSSKLKSQVGPTIFQQQVSSTNGNNFESQLGSIDQCNYELNARTSNLSSEVCTVDSSNFELQVAHQHNFLDAERETSKMLSASRVENRRDKFTFICECRLDGQCLNVIMDPVTSDIFIPKLAIFLKDYIPKCIDKMV